MTKRGPVLKLVDVQGSMRACGALRIRKVNWRFRFSVKEIQVQHCASEQDRIGDCLVARKIYLICPAQSRQFDGRITVHRSGSVNPLTILRVERRTGHRTGRNTGRNMW